MTRWCHRLATAAVAASCGLVIAAPARAWDPARTHTGITERAVARGTVHARWMQGSGDRLGWFTPLRIAPSRLDPATRRALVVAMREAHADVGGVAAGGPGACPPQPAPSETLQRCVDGDAWETTALGWVRVGIALEAVPRARLLHHFADLDDPAAPRWHAHGRSRGTWRRIERQAGGTMAARVARSGFAGTGPSAIGWLADGEDPWAPAAMHRHLRAASLLAEPEARAQELALAMVALGATLHVIQDLTLPAHARGDLLGTRVPLSDERRDRGSPLAEYARLIFARALPEPLVLASEPTAAPAASLRALLLGDAAHDGVIEFTAGHFFSDGSLPKPVAIDPGLDAAAAATALLGADAHLDDAEQDGAVLAPWPADSGYVRTKTGRALAAWRRLPDGTVQPYLDRRILREHALRLLPLAVDATAAALELWWPAWPDARWDRASNSYELDRLEGTRDGELTVVIEQADGRRTVARRIALPHPRNRVRGITPDTMPEGAHVVLVLAATRDDGQRVLIEQRLDRTGTPDAGTSDAGTPDAGTSDAGTSDAGTPDAGTPDAGTPDAGTPDAR